MFNFQIIFLACAFTCLNFASGEVSKDVGMTRFYKELGCKLKPAGSKDPVSYECPSMAGTDKTCVVKGKTYALGEKIVSEPGVCLAECVCNNAHRGKLANVLCANIECPEFMGVPVRRQCTRTYSLDKCCATGLQCEAAAQKDVVPNDTTKVVYKESTTPTFTCNVGGGKKVEEFSKYYPDDLPCTKCVCMKGHDGTNKAPWCADIPCSMQYRFNKELHSGCAPVFIKTSLCCPLQFRCPALALLGEDKVIPLSTSSADTKAKVADKAVKDTKAVTEKGPQCSFGNLKLNVGDKLSAPADDTKLDCICEIPPFVTCYKSTL